MMGKRLLSSGCALAVVFGTFVGTGVPAAAAMTNDSWMYLFRMQTGCFGGAGTDGDISVAIKNNNGEWTDWKLLDAPGYDDFERCDNDVYGVRWEGVSGRRSEFMIKWNVGIDHWQWQETEMGRDGEPVTSFGTYRAGGSWHGGRGTATVQLS